MSAPFDAIAARREGNPLRAAPIRELPALPGERERRTLLLREQHPGLGRLAVERLDRGQDVLLALRAEALERTQFLLARDVLVDYRPGAGIRIAPHFYTSDAELDAAIEAIDEALTTDGWRAFERGHAVVT